MPKVLLLGVMLAMLTQEDEALLVERCLTAYQVCTHVTCDDRSDAWKYVDCRRECQTSYLACMAEVDLMRERT